MRMDLADPLSIGLAVGQVLEAWGHVDVLVNNAIYTGQGAQASVLDLKLADLREEIDVDIVAPDTHLAPRPQNGGAGKGDHSQRHLGCGLHRPTRHG